MERHRLGDVLPDYAEALAERLREAGWAHLADSVGDIRIFGVSVADDRCGLITSSSPADRIGALHVTLAQEIVEVKIDRIVSIEIREAEPARSMVRSLTAIAAAL